MTGIVVRYKILKTSIISHLSRLYFTVGRFNLRRLSLYSDSFKAINSDALFRIFFTSSIPSFIWIPDENSVFNMWPLDLYTEYKCIQLNI